jgi:hypothetical protein
MKSFSEFSDALNHINEYGGNAIIISNDNKTRSVKIEIEGHADFDYYEDDYVGVRRQYVEERKVSPINPINIQKISFIVNGKTINFLREEGDPEISL